MGGELWGPTQMTNFTLIEFQQGLIPQTPLLWPNHTDCVFCAEPEKYAKEKNISIKEAERIRKRIVADSPNDWEY